MADRGEPSRLMPAQCWDQEKRSRAEDRAGTGGGARAGSRRVWRLLHEHRYFIPKLLAFPLAAFILFFHESAQPLLALAISLYAVALTADLASTSWFLKRGETEGNPVMAYLLHRLRSFGWAAAAVLAVWEWPGVALMTAVLMLNGFPPIASLTAVLAALAVIHASAAAHNWDLY